MSQVQRLFRQIQKLFAAAEMDGVIVGDRVERIGMNRLWEQLHGRLRDAMTDESPYMMLHDVFYDRGLLYAIISREGQLYRMDVDIVDDNVTLGSEVRVQESFFPIGRARTTVMRQADGRYRGVMVAATSVLNRVGEIDTRKLFDNFVRRANETGRYPIIDFAHKRDRIRLGEADYVAREGYAYVVSYLFDDTPIGRAAAEGIQSDPDYWGASISYDPIDGELVEVADGVRVPAYTDGVNDFVSILSERSAANLFTRHVLRGGIPMNEKLLDDLRKLVGDDIAAEFAEEVDGLNRSIEDEGLIVRSTDEGEVEAEAETETDAVERDDETESDDVEAQAESATDEASVDETEVIIDDETIGLIAEAVVGSDVYQTALTEGMAGLREEIAALTRAVERMNSETVAEVLDRLDRLEEDDVERMNEYVADLPRRRRLNVSYRPRQQRAADTDDEDEPEPESVKIVETALSKLPDIPGM